MSAQTQTAGGVMEEAGTGGLLVIVGTVLTAVAAVLPWLSASMGGESVNGIDLISDATLPIFSAGMTVVLAVVAVGLTVFAARNPNARTVETICGVLIVAVAAVFLFTPGTAFGGGQAGALVEAFVDPGIGTFATLGGGLAITAGGVLGYYG